MKKTIIAFAFMLMMPIANADVSSWSSGESKTATQVQQEIEEARRQAELNLKYTIECANGNNQSCVELEYVKSQSSKLGLDANFVEQFQKTFTSEINAWLPPIKKAATYLLFTLGIIALVLKMIPLVLKGADLGEIIKELIVFILVISLWYAIIINAKEWTDAIIDSFMKLAYLANKNSMEATPVSVLKQGFVVVSKIFIGSYNPITLLTQVICALVIIVIYAKIAFYVLKVMLETFIVSYGGIVLLGFGALTFTSEYAKRYVTYVISCGIKLFMALLIVGFGGNFISSFLSLDFTLFGNCVAIVAIALMLMFIAEQIPDFAQSMITGASLGGGNMNIGGTLATMAAAATAFTAACYAGAAAFKAAGVTNAVGGGTATTGGLQGADLANALSKGISPDFRGKGNSAGSNSLPNGGKSGAQLWAEGKVPSPSSKAGTSQDSRTEAAFKAFAKSVREGMVNKAAGARGSIAANITRAALNNAAHSHQSTESPRKPIASPYAKSRGNSKTPNKGHSDTGEINES